MSIPSIHPAPEVLADYHAGRLPVAERLVVSDHLEDCPACRALLGASAERLEKPTDMFDLPTILPDTPPGYDEMAALLDGTLNEAQRTESRARMAAWPEAAAEFADLERFRNEARSLPARLHGPDSRQIGQSNTVAPTLGKVIAFPRRWPTLAAAAAVILLLAGGWLAFGVRRHSSTPLWADADLSGLPEDLRHSVEQAAQTGKVAPLPLSPDLRPAAGTLTGATPATADFGQITPVGIIVREQRPTLRWTAHAGATSYRIYLAEVSGDAPLVRDEVAAPQTEWTPPTPLVRGAIYEWQVEARRGGEIIDRAPRPPAPETRFQVLDQARADELARVEAGYRQNPLVLGTEYSRLGLDEAAVAQFMELAQRFPGSAVAQNLLWKSRDRKRSPP